MPVPAFAETAVLVGVLSTAGSGSRVQWRMNAAMFKTHTANCSPDTKSTSKRGVRGERRGSLRPAGRPPVCKQQLRTYKGTLSSKSCFLLLHADKKTNSNLCTLEHYLIRRRCFAGGLLHGLSLSLSDTSTRFHVTKHAVSPISRMQQRIKERCPL